MYRHLGAVGLTALVTTAGLTLPVPAGSAVQCGDRVATDIVLTKDLTCSGPALRVAVAAGQTLKVDLNGHRLQGDGTGTGLDTAFYTPPGHLGGTLVVTDGTITGFASAVVGPTGSAPLLQNLTMTNLKVTGNGTWHSRRVLRATVVEKSIVIDSGTGGAYTDSSSLTVRNSQFIRSSISSASESVNYLYDNMFSAGGFSASTSSSVIATGNTFLDCTTGISMNSSWISPMQIDNNLFKHCRTGVRLNGMLGPVSVQGNSFIENTVAGMTYLNDTNRALRISGNMFLRNAGDGLSGADTRAYNGPATGAGPTRISDNDAIGNYGWGINATGVVTDGGGNFARRNRGPGQCRGVTCR